MSEETEGQDSGAEAAAGGMDVVAEALAYAGKRDEAKKQFAIAAGLDLATADRADLRAWEKRT